MKRLKIIFTAALTFALALVISLALPHKTSADDLSDAFRTILDENGNLVIHDSTGTSGSDSISSVLSGFKADTGYSFDISYEYDDETGTYITLIDMNNSTVTISMYDGSDEIERHTVKFIYDTTMSDAFKEALKLNENGEFLLHNSTGKITPEWISSYLSDADENKKYCFALDSNYNEELSTDEYAIDDAMSKGTVIMYAMEQSEGGYSRGGEIERHIVNFKVDTSISDTYKQMIHSEDGKTIILNSVKPTSYEEFYALFEYLINGLNFDVPVYPENISEDFSSCDINANREIHTVKVEYQFDKEIHKSLMEIIKAIPSDTSFCLNITDMEVINYWTSLSKNDSIGNISGFSGELKKLLNSYNVKLAFDPRCGEDAKLSTFVGGISWFMFDNTVYHLNNMLMSGANHIIYVPDNTKDTAKDFLAAAQKRIDEYLGEKTSRIKYMGKAEDIVLRKYYETDLSWKDTNPDMTFEEYKNSPFRAAVDLQELVTETGLNEIQKDTDYYSITFNDLEHYFIIKKDSSKMVIPEYSTADMSTDISIRSTDSSIPLDTAIQAKEIAEGAELDNILRHIDTKNSQSFDIKLFSDTLGDYITKLANGKFQVNIPVSKSLSGKQLAAYYVDSNNKVTKYDVTVSDGTASFTTDHFSIYTLAEVEKKDNDLANSNTGTGTFLIVTLLILSLACMTITIRCRKHA